MTASSARDTGFLLLTGTYFLLGGLLFFTRGLYNGPGVLILIALAAVIAWCFIRASRTSAPPDAILTLSICSVSACFSLWLAVDPRLAFAEPNGGLRALQMCLGIGAACAIALWVAAVLRGRLRIMETIAAVAVVLALCARACVIAASPHPFIDVYSLTAQAAQFLLNGADPYHQVYRNIYQQGALDPTQVFQYPPAYLLWAAGFVRALGDVRWNQVCAEIATAVALFRIVRMRMPETSMPWLFVVAWLSFPVSYFVIEQAWVDPFVVALVAWLAWALQRERLLAAGALTGVLLVSKQYCLLLGVVTAAWVFAHHRPRWKAFAGAAVAVVAALLAPFVVSDWRGLYYATVQEVLATPMRPDALTARALALDGWGVSIPEWPAAAIDAITLALVCWRVSRSRRGTLQEWAGALALVYLVVFICGPQAFCNYYYLVSFFVLLWLAFRVTTAAAPPVPAPRAVTVS